MQPQNDHLSHSIESVCSICSRMFNVHFSSNRTNSKYIEQLKSILLESSRTWPIQTFLGQRCLGSSRWQHRRRPAAPAVHNYNYQNIGQLHYSSILYRSLAMGALWPGLGRLILENCPVINWPLNLTNENNFTFFKKS